MYNKVLLIVIGFAFAGACSAQLKLSLDEAIKQALQSRASLKAENERVLAARGLKRQASVRPNPEFLFQNENLRPGQTYTRDVDTVAYVTQPLDILGKRAPRISVAEEGIGRTQAEYDLARVHLIDSVKFAYWTARGAQETREVLEASVANFQKTVDYHAARLSAGAIAEQDFLRVRLESERLKITANLAAIEANRAVLALLKEMASPVTTGVVLTEPLEAGPPPPDTGFAQRSELKTGARRACGSRVEGAPGSCRRPPRSERVRGLQAHPIARHQLRCQHRHCRISSHLAVDRQESGKPRSGGG